jgi:mono/diheme cytochrome c family protein
MNTSRIRRSAALQGCPRIRQTLRVAVAAAVVAGAIALDIQRGEAHKAITSKYTYNDDVFPIFRERCSRCHVPGGVAPMSLMTYDEAFPWAESIRAELVAAHMPPWNADDGFGELKRAHTLTSKELDVIMTWASGGNPRGALDQKLPEVTLTNDWTMGAPDLALKLPSEATLAADKMDETQEFTLPTGLTEARWVRAVDLLPGTPSIVRSAIVSLKGSATAAGSSPAPDRVLARWVPGHDAEAVEGAAFKLPAGAELVARIHYKKTWQFEGKPLSDRSTIGVYFAQARDARELLALPITSPTLPGPEAIDRIVTFSQTIDEDVQALALSPDQVPPNITVQVEAVKPDGSRAPIIRLNTRPDWNRRYWFERPLTLPRGTKVEVTARLEDPDVLSAAFSAGSPARSAPAVSTVRLALNVVPAHSKPAAP